MEKKKHKILIVDDSEMNRAILLEMLEDEYDIIEAEDGERAIEMIQKHETEISLILLDIVMPKIDGFGVLKIMEQKRWIEDIPVIMISAESGASHVEKAYKMGVTDFISRPFDALIVHKRVVNTILLYAKQKRLMSIVEEQIYEKEVRSSLMIDILSHIVEFRNGESGLHVLHVRTLTEMLLHYLVRITDQYKLSEEDIAMIGVASALHDIGKIAIPAEILNKPGRLTDEEFAQMKTHSAVGAQMLKELPIHQEEPLVQIAHDICRWHHERYDGRGYPDGLKGDDIPISAQIVALADVYDALTSERCYKKAFSHEKAVQMILNGECGTFNPLLLKCLSELSDHIRDELGNNFADSSNQREMRKVVVEMLKYEDLSSSEITHRLLEHERMKYSFFAEMSEEIQFEYTSVPSMVNLSEWSAKKLGLSEIIVEPMKNEKIVNMMDTENMNSLIKMLRNTTPEKPVVQYDCTIKLNGEDRWMRFICRAMWSNDEQPQYTGAIGKVVDIHDARIQRNNLEHMAAHDWLTGLFNHNYAKREILDRIKKRPDSKFAIVIMDLDTFRNANYTHGHLFGNKILKETANKLKQNIRSDDIAARIGGDEFLIFMEYKDGISAAIERIMSRVSGKYEEFVISLSVGLAETDIVGADYDKLFSAANQALSVAKKTGGGKYMVYNDTMSDISSELSPIDVIKDNNTNL